MLLKGSIEDKNHNPLFSSNNFFIRQPICLDQDLLANMHHYDLDLQMTLTFNIVL